jgi:hypothetical protein
MGDTLQCVGAAARPNERGILTAELKKRAAEVLNPHTVLRT